MVAAILKGNANRAVLTAPDEPTLMRALETVRLATIAAGVEEFIGTASITAVDIEAGFDPAELIKRLCIKPESTTARSAGRIRREIIG